MSRNLSTQNKSFLLIAFSLLLSTTAGAWELPTKPFHLDFISLASGEVWHSAGTVAGSSQCVELNVATPGLLTLEARVPATTESEPHLITMAKRGQGTMLARQAAHLTFLASPGSQRFCVAAQDPLLGLADLKIVAAFVELAPDKDGNPDEGGNGEDPREMEIEPEGLRADPCAFGFGKDGNPDEGGNGEDPREIEIEPEGFMAEVCTLARTRAELCRRLDASAGDDDHGDTFLCATPVSRGQGLVGELRNPWGDDRDVFEVTVTEIATLQIQTDGETDTFGGLYTEQGYRLAASDDGGRDENFRLVKTLLPGRYFVHVESSGRDEGAYRLHIDALP